MTETLRIRRAAADDMETIIELIDDARAWLPGKGTDQWAEPWPNPAARDARVLRDLKAGRTWLVEEDDEAPVATVTCNDKGNRRLWTPKEQLVNAVYMARLIVRRSRAGEGIGEALVNWTGSRGVRCWSAKWIRIDVWTTNEALHNYYEKRGFQHYKVCEFKESEYYPSAALFQKTTAEIDPESVARFHELTGLAAAHKDVILPARAVPPVPLVSSGRKGPSSTREL
jgi:GNAT superfamily N-acetyltransferase